MSDFDAGPDASGRPPHGFVLDEEARGATGDVIFTGPEFHTPDRRFTIRLSWTPDEGLGALLDGPAENARIDDLTAWHALIGEVLSKL